VLTSQDCNLKQSYRTDYRANKIFRRYVRACNIFRAEPTTLATIFARFDSRRANAEGDAWLSASERTRSRGHGRRALVHRQPPDIVRARDRPDRAFSRGNMIFRMRRHAPRLAKIAERRCAPRRAAPHATRTREIATWTANRHAD